MHKPLLANQIVMRHPKLVMRFGMSWARLVILLLMLPMISHAADLEAGRDAYYRGDYTAAFAEFQPLADLGNQTARRYLAYLYLYGNGVQPGCGLRNRTGLTA